MAARRDFLSMPAPENYVAGLGRGATGFTTRSDLGPAREGPSDEQMKELLARRAAQLGQAPPSAYGVDAKKKEDDDDDDRFQDPDNEEGLFSSGISHDKEDDEADLIYQQVEEKMEKRRKHQRDAREKQEREDYERQNPKIHSQFSDLKRKLADVTEEEWANLPEVGDMTGRTKRAREARLNNRSYAVPDSVLQAASQQGQLETSIPSGPGSGTMTNFESLGAANKSAFQVRLDSAAKNVTGTLTSVNASNGSSTMNGVNGAQAAIGSGTGTSVGTATSVDAKGYLTALNTSTAGAAPIEDINRARVLLESAVKTNLQNGPGHVALCRLEELAGKVHTARKIIARGCELCPHSIVCWEENIRINRENLHNAKIIAANAIKLNPKAVKLWLAAIELETTSSARKKVARQGLDHNPQAVELWKILINETDDLEAVKMLFSKATSTVKLSEELWISFARISDPEQAQQILNSARKAMPTSWAIWIQACRLQEQLGKPDMAERLMERAVKALTKEHAMPSRETWIEQAELCEAEGAVATASGIVKTTIGYGLELTEDRKEKWLHDAKSSIYRGKIAVARAIYIYALSEYPTSTKIYHAWIDLERKHGALEQLIEVFEQSINACPNAESLWSAYARDLWLAGDADRARLVMARSFAQLPGNENLYIRAVEFEVDAGNFDKARMFLEMARSSAATDRIWTKSANLERQLQQYDRSLELIRGGLESFPHGWKLHAVKGQLYEERGMLKEAQDAFNIGTRAAPDAPVLYILLSRLQEKMGLTTKARSTLDRGRQKNPTSADLHLEGVRFERRAGNTTAAQQLMAVALQKCPTSGILWAERIMHLEVRTARKPRALEAIKKVENDVNLFVVVARIFWGERRLDKASNWFNKAINLDRDFGDAWIWFYKFLKQHGTEEKKAEVLAQIEETEPKHGEIWQSVSKDPKNFRKKAKEILLMAVDKI